MTDQDIIRVLGEDHVAGTEAFREALLARCLAAVRSQGQADSADGESADLTDEDLGLLAAAGSTVHEEEPPVFG